MKTVIFCGGLGTRLREETEFRPKPLLEIGARPILWHIMKGYAARGFSDFVLCLGYRGDMIREYFLQYEAMHRDFTVRLGSNKEVTYHDAGEDEFLVTLAETGADTLTGGRLARVQRYVGGETFMATYGDGVSDVNLSALLKFHRAHGKIATVTAVQPISRFGALDVDASGRVQRFAEKPRSDGFISAGFFVFEPQIFDYLGGDGVALEGEPLERLAREGQLMAFEHPGFFYAMDTFREYTHLNALWNENRAPWKTWS